MPRLTAEQRGEERARGLGASDIATIAGVNPFRTAFELYLEKIGELDPDARIDEAARGRMERGHRLEDVALEWDRDISGEPFERVSRTVWHPRLPFMFCHPDARRKPWSKTRRLIEVKTTARKWTAIPRYVELQVVAQMACTGATSADIVVLGFDGPPTRFTLERDEQMIEAVEQLATAFWSRVVNREPPPLDGSDGAVKYLDRLRTDDGEELRADQAQAQAVQRMLDLNAEITRLEAERAATANALKFSMLGSTRLVARGVGKATWMAPTEAHSVRWKDVAAALRGELEEEAWSAIVSEFTSVTERSGWLKVTPFERED